MAVPFREVGQGPFPEMGSARVAGIAQALTGVGAEEEFHLIDPGGMDGREVKVEAPFLPLVEIYPAAREVRVEVVPDHMDWAFRIGQGHLLHEGQEVRMGPSLTACRQGLARMHIHGGDQGLGAMPDVFELLAAPSPRLGRPVQVFALDGLDSGLLIDG